MTNALETTRQKLADLGISTAEAVAERFGALRMEFDGNAAVGITDETTWKALRDA